MLNPNHQTNSDSAFRREVEDNDDISLLAFILMAIVSIVVAFSIMIAPVIINGMIHNQDDITGIESVDSDWEEGHVGEFEETEDVVEDIQ